MRDAPNSWASPSIRHNLADYLEQEGKAEKSHTMCQVF